MAKRRTKKPALVKNMRTLAGVSLRQGNRAGLHIRKRTRAALRERAIRDFAD